jgi:hypothetical protein
MPVIDLTTRDRVKRRYSINGAQTDQLIDELIQEVSADVTRYLGRHIWTTSRTEVYEIGSHDHYVSLRGAPIESVTSVTYHSSRDFSSATALSASAYDINNDEGTIFIRVSTPFSPGFVQVVYSGGLVTASSEDAATASIVTEYPDIAGAVDKQVIEEHRRRLAQTGTVVVRGSQTQQFVALGLMPDVKRRLDFFRRRVWK